MGYEKPSEKFFETVFEEIGIKPSGKSLENEKLSDENTPKRETVTVNRDEILIIGDSLTSDIKGGNNCGIKTCWYNPNHAGNESELRIDYEIDNLKHLLTFL